MFIIPLSENKILNAWLDHAFGFNRDLGDRV
ncbi:hypothetical protein pEaSNUABM37_00222 [Erwinia phage pEa_SNUABM_37]|nr:hypothetical protein pEaSNUABM37_00222 [Erwinia phage pEa_SNUABM_37]QXO10692.1 hypothetical protein pEaSNUABM48_00222 [Erwinia phage pEa_SNUABM_48]